jgi:hypothetical protein
VLTQLLLRQSPLTAHVLVSTHLVPGAQPPPQSMSVSVPFLTASVQLLAWQTLPVQTPV